MKFLHLHFRIHLGLALALLGLASPGSVRAQTFLSPPAGGTSGIPPALRRTLHDAVDFGSDGRIELRIVEEVDYRNPGRQGRRYVDPAPGVTLVGDGFRTFKRLFSSTTNSETKIATPGLIVDPATPRFRPPRRR